MSEAMLTVLAFTAAAAPLPLFGKRVAVAGWVAICVAYALFHADFVAAYLLAVQGVGIGLISWMQNAATGTKRGADRKG